MKISSRTARLATATALVGIFVVGGGVSAIDASTGPKPSGKSITTSLPTVNTLRTKNGALPTTLPPKLGKGTTTSMPRVKNGVPKSSNSVKPKGS